MTIVPSLFNIKGAGSDDHAALLALNSDNAEQTSYLSAERWGQLIDQAFLATRTKDNSGFLISLDETADYDSVNYGWFVKRFERFAYVDRIVIGEHRRGAGLARGLYESLFEVAKSAGHTRVCCEVNRVPPNPGSDAFHARLGFRPLNIVELDSGKTVTYLCRDL